MRTAAATAICCLLLPFCRAAEPRADRLGDPLPAGACQRLGTLRLRFASGIGDLCYLPDGRAAFVVGNRLEIWDMVNGRMLNCSEIGQHDMNSVVPNHVGTVLLLTDSNGDVCEWELATAHERRRWATGQAGLRRAHYSPDEQRVLTTGARPPTIREWELRTPKELVSIPGEMHYFHEALYGPDGRTAFAVGGAGSNPVIAHYDLASGKALKQWHKDYYTHARSIELSADRERLLVGSRHMGTEWRLSDYTLLRKFTGHHGHAVTAVAYCMNPEELLTGSRDGSIRRWNRLNGEMLLRWVPHNGHVTRIAVSPDGQWILSYGSRMVAECSVETGRPRIPWERHGAAVEGVSFLPDGRRAISVSQDATARIWDVHTGETVRSIAGAELGGYAVAVAPDGAKAAVGCKDGIVREFDLSDGTPARSCKGHRGYVRSLAYTHDGKQLLSSADDGSIRVWDNATTAAAQLTGHQGGVLAIAVSPDDTQVLSGGRDGSVRLWRLKDATCLKVLQGHWSWVQAVAFLPAAERAVSGASGGEVRVWNLRTGECELTYQCEGSVHAIVCAPDGRTAYSAGSFDQILAWDPGSGQLRHAWAGHERAIQSLALSPDGTRLVSASEDTSLLVWDVADAVRP